MSYEGFSQFWCKNGHYWTLDCDEVTDVEKCPECGELSLFENMVDETNCTSDGYIKPELESEKKCDKCGSTLESKYKIPKETNHE